MCPFFKIEKSENHSTLLYTISLFKTLVKIFIQHEDILIFKNLPKKNHPLANASQQPLCNLTITAKKKFPKFKLRQHQRAKTRILEFFLITYFSSLTQFLYIHM